MHPILLIIMISFLTSCSSLLDRKIEDKSWDGMSNESFLRWGEDRLKTANGDVVKCYQGNTSEALDIFRQNYLKDNKSPYYWLHIGNCFFMEKSWSKAEFFYRMSSESQSSTIKAIAFNNLGLLSFKYEQWERGKEYLQKAMSLSPKFKVPRFNLSQLFLQFGLYDRAIELLNHESFREHKDIDVYFSLANAHFFKGDYAKAEHFFRLIPDSFKKREDIAATLAIFQLKKGQLKDARETMNDRDRSHVLQITLVSQKIEKILLQRMKED